MIYDYHIKKKELIMKDDEHYINTKYGNAWMNDSGFFKITSKKEGNFNKHLQTAVYEDINNMKIPKDMIVDFYDGNPYNCLPNNLCLVTKKNYQKKHNGSKGFMVEDIKLFRKSVNAEVNSTGFYRVCKYRRNGHIYCRYNYLNENGELSAIVNEEIFMLKKDVLEKGLIWKEVPMIK